MLMLLLLLMMLRMPWAMAIRSNCYSASWQTGKLATTNYRLPLGCNFTYFTCNLATDERRRQATSTMTAAASTARFTFTSTSIATATALGSQIAVLALNTDGPVKGKGNWELRTGNSELGTELGAMLQAECCMWQR